MVDLDFRGNDILTLTAESASLRQLSTARKLWTRSRRLTTFGVFFGTYFPWNQQFAPANKPFAPNGNLSSNHWFSGATLVLGRVEIKIQHVFLKVFFIPCSFFFKTSFQNWNKKQIWRCVQIWFAQKHLFDFYPRKSSDSPPTPTNLPKGTVSTGLGTWLVVSSPISRWNC